MHDHALHELHILRRTWRKCGTRRWRQCPGRLARRTRLHHDRRPSISLLLLSLLCADREREHTRESTGSHQPPSPRSASHYRLELTLSLKIKSIHRRERLTIERGHVSHSADKV